MSKLTPKQKSEVSATRLWLIMWKASRALEQNAIDSVAGLGLGLSDFAVLEVLVHKGPQPVNVIGRKVLLTSGSITAAVDRLELRKLVRRTTDPHDGRARIVQLTEAGKRLIEKAFERHEVDMEQAMTVLNCAERIELIRLLKKVGLWAEAKLAGREGDVKV